MKFRIKKRLIKTLDKYLFSEAFSLYLVGFFGFLAFLIINQLFLEGDRLLNPNFPTREILKLILLNVPYFITLTIPVAVLFATLMSMGRLAKDNEIDAFFTNGIHLSRLFVPFFVLAIANVFFNYYVNENWVPKANAAAESIYEKYPYLREQESVEVDPVIVRLPGGAFFASSFVDKKSGTVFYAVHDTLTLADSNDNESPTVGENSRAETEKATGLPLPENPSVEATSAQSSERGPEKGHDSLKTGAGAGEVSSENSLLVKDVGKNAVQGDTSGNSDNDEEASRNGQSVGEVFERIRGILYFSTNAQIVEDRLNMSNPYAYYVSDDGLVVKRETQPYVQLSLGLPLKDLYSTIKTPEQLSREELERQTRFKRQVGLNPAKDATDFHLKFSIPFASLFLALVAVPLSLRAPRDERLLGLVFVYILGTGYYLVHFVSKLMGYNEILPPALAAWMQNIVFFFIGIIIFAFSRK